MLPGRLGMTIAPGKRDPFERQDLHRDLDEDVTRLRAVYGADVLVSLVEEKELAILEIDRLFERLAAEGIARLHYPIRDLSVPDDDASFDALVDKVIGLVGDRKTVVVHCRGGIGRTGLLAACCLVARGMAPKAAIDCVREARSPRMVETPEQRAYVTRYAERRRKGA